MFKKIIKYYADRQLQRYDLSHQREKKIKTLSDSKFVGIIWNPADIGGIEIYEALRKNLNNKGIKSIGIAHIESTLEMETLSTVTHSGFLHKRHVEMMGCPKTSAGLDFLEQQFDILIDISIIKTIPLLYLLVHSKAKFKVGWQGEGNNFYDLNIDVSKNPNSQYLMEQIVYYLENINEGSLNKV